MPYAVYYLFLPNFLMRVLVSVVLERVVEEVREALRDGPGMPGCDQAFVRSQEVCRALRARCEHLDMVA